MPSVMGSYLHGRRILHRDVKETNLLLCSNGLVKLSDLGIATQLSSAASTRFSVVGTPTHMAPEAIMPHTHAGAVAVPSEVRPAIRQPDRRLVARHHHALMGECEMPKNDAREPFELATQIVTRPAPSLRPSTHASASPRSPSRDSSARALVR